MMQLYYTSCVPGRSKSGEGGFQVRACTPTLSVDRQRAVLRYAGYRLAAGYDEDTPPSQAPTRLALLDTDAGRLLCHSTYIGRDPTTNRTGVYFSHLLIDVPKTLDAGTAAATWKASFWRTSDGDMAVDLDDWTQVPRPRAQERAGLDAFARKNLELVTFLWAGILSLPADQRLFVVALPEDVCTAVCCLSQVLPRPLAEQLTFSTYEADPLSCPARIVGTWWKSPELDLPSACYNGCGLGYNTLTRKTSPQPALPPFATWALEQIAQGRSEELARFYEDCDRLGAKDLGGYDLVWRVMRQGNLGQSQVEQATALPRLAARLMQQPGMASKGVEWALNDPNHRKTYFSKLASAGGESIFAGPVWAEAIKALKGERLERAGVALDELLPIVDPKRFQALGDALAAELEPQALTWKTRAAILPRVLRGQSLRADPAKFNKWLAVSAANLGNLLGLLGDDETRLRATHLCLAQTPSGGERPALVAVATNANLAMSLLSSLGKDSAGQGRILVLFEELLGQASRTGQGGWLGRGHSRPVNGLVGRIRELHQQGAVGAATLDACLKQAFVAGGFDAVEYVREAGGWLLGVKPALDCPAGLANRLFRDAPEAGDKIREVRDFLTALRSHPSYPQVSPAVRASLDRENALAEFLARPSLDEPSLVQLAGALGGIAEKKRRQIVQAVVACLVNTPTDAVQRRLERALQYLAPMASPGKSWLFGLIWKAPPPDRWDGLFFELFDQALRSPQGRQNESLLFALLSVGLSAGIRNPWVAKRFFTASNTNNTAAHTEPFIRRMTSECHPKIMARIQELANKNWRQYDHAMQWWSRGIDPRSTLGRKSDPVFWLMVTVLIGMFAVLAFQMGVPGWLLAMIFRRPQE